MVSLLSGPSCRSRGLTTHTGVCTLWRRQECPVHTLSARVSQRALSERHSPKRSVVTITTVLRAPGGTHSPPPTGGQRNFPTLRCGAWPLTEPSPAGECEDSVISFRRLLLRNSRPATGPRTQLKIHSGLQTESPVPGAWAGRAASESPEVSRASLLSPSSFQGSLGPRESPQNPR